MSTTTPQLLELEEQATAVIRGTVPMAELGPFIDASFATLAETLQHQGMAPSGAAFARYDGPPGDVVELEVGFTTGTPVAPEGDVVASTLPAGPAARTVYTGGYDGLGAAWGELKSWIGAQGRAPGRLLWEVYLTEPRPETDPADLRTELTWQVV